MKVSHAIMFVGLGLGASACATVDVSTRNTLFELTQPAPQPNTSDTAAVVVKTQAIVPGQTPVHVNSVTVNVPRSLKVSEANRYYPNGDIVWRGDPAGDRYLQVQKIFETAMARGVAPLDGPVNVDVDIEVVRFHGVTEKARYTVGGVHSITFNLALRNPKTGELLVPVRTVRADLEALGGRHALEAEAIGQTQKVRITDHLSNVILQELTDPDGYKNASLGFMQLLNDI